VTIELRLFIININLQRVRAWRHLTDALPSLLEKLLLGAYIIFIRSIAHPATVLQLNMFLLILQFFSPYVSLDIL
jgi:hypothetical protein